VPLKGVNRLKNKQIKINLNDFKMNCSLDEISVVWSANIENILETFIFETIELTIMLLGTEN